MATGKLYIWEWLEYIGKNANWLSEATGLHRSHISKILSGQRKRALHPSTVEKIAKAIGQPTEKLFVNPMQQVSQPVTLVNLEDWLTSPLATFNGKIADAETKEKVRQILELVLSGRGK